MLTEANIRALMNATVFDHANPIWLQLVDRHPERDSKVGAGIASFSRKRNIAGHWGLWITRLDGSKIDISWRTCVRGKPASTKSKLRSAMRNAIASDIAEFKSALWRTGVACALCKATLVSKAKAHVDHAQTSFETLASRFMLGKEAPESFVDDPVSNGPAFSKEHAELEQAWLVYHQTHCTLELICQQCNLRKPKR